jgi:hypothetical protein
MKGVRSLALSLPCLLAACSGANSSTGGIGTGGSTGGGTGANTGAGGAHAGTGGSSGSPGCDGGCTDFAGQPFGPDGTTASVPAGAAQAFAGTPAATGGPCLLEPQDGTLLPNNWLRPRFSWTSTGSGDLYELHVTAPNQSPDLVVYTDKTSWTMPQAMWVGLGSHTRNMAITATILSARGSAVSTGTSAAFTVAPVGASGSLVYRSPQGSIHGGQTTLNGFAVGDQSVRQVLACGSVSCDVKAPATTWQTDDPSGLMMRPVQCIGCHTSTPDGNFISFNDASPWGGVLASGQPDPSLFGSAPTFLGSGGFKAFIQPWLGMTTYSGNHWSDADHIVVAPLGGSGPSTDDSDQKPGLAWFDLENASALPANQNPFTALKGTAWNWIYPPTSGKYAAAPSWSHMPGNDFVVFTAASKVRSGRLATGTAHLYQVPYSKTAPQAATPIPGMDDLTNPRYAQYYGTLSFDDAYIVYDQIPAAAAAATHPDLNTTDPGCSGTCSWDGMYMQPAAELYVTPTVGGPGVRLAANDPPSCPEQPKSGTINNSWGKWSPDVATFNGSTYYWIVFSSWRQGGTDTNGDPIAQLFMTAIVKSATGLIETYPAVYLWNQPANVSNFTPAWDVFKIGNAG